MKNKICFVLLALLLVGGGCKDNRSLQGDAHFRNKEYQLAIEAYNDYLSLKPNNIKSLYNRGRSYEELGDFNRALQDYNRILEINPDNIQANLSIGKDFYRKNVFDNAAFYFDKVIKVDDTNAVAHFFKGRSLHKSGLFREALQAYNLAININQDYGEAYLYRGALHISYLKKRSSACNDFKMAKSLNVEDADEAVERYCR